MAMGNCFKILLIDDDDEDHLIVKDLVSKVRWTKFHLDRVATFEEGLEAIRRNEHDVYLLDYRLGKRDGLELVLEASSSGCEPAIIMLTGLDEIGLDLRAMQAGVADYLVKDDLRTDILERSIHYAVVRKNTENSLRRARDELEARVEERTADLRRAYDDMEAKVHERTVKLAMANQALEAEVKKRRKIEEALRLDEMRLKALWEVSRMNQAPDEEIARFILDKQIEITGSMFGALRITEEDENALTIYSSTEGAGDPLGFPYVQEEFWSHFGQMPLVINDFAAFGHPVVADGAPARAMYVPVLDSGRVAGVVMLAGKKSDYDESNARQVSLLLEGMWWFVQRQRSNKALREAERSLRLMADSLPVLISYIDRSQYYRFANRAYEHLFGMASDRIVGLKVRELLGPRVFEITRPHIEMALNGREVRFELEGMFPAGERFLSVYYIPNLDDSGEVAGFFALTHDLTERKRDEVKAQRLRDELAHITRVATMGEISSSLAHELGQPLTAIMSNAQAARRFLERAEPDVEEVKLALEDIVDDCRRAGNVIKRLRSILKKEPFQKATLEINDLVEETVKLLANSALKNNIGVRICLCDGLPPISGDRIQLQQVLINLILNGFDAMASIDRGSRLMTIRTSYDSDKITVEVTDAGPGIDPDQMSRIFEPFVTTKMEGMGMGLPISRHILEAHSGRLWARRNSDCGMTFSFSLPVEEN
ncbi:MAG: PAS domain-containing protein [Syntrophobacteraceae bacterium]|nr:PAS domain-containing protein [Syntrophobacteraceae bacterium]